MKTMKLLPLKIAVTSAMIIGLGAASTANAQAQSGLTYLEQARGLVDYHYNNYEGLKGLDLKGLNNNNVSSELKKKGLELNRELNKFKTETFTNQQLHVAAMEELGESIDDLYEANEENVERIVTIDHAAAANRQNIQDLAKAQLAGVEVMTELNKNVEENKVGIQKNANSVQNLKTLYETSIRTVGNNEKAIGEHQKLIADNKADIAKNKANIQDLAKAQLAGVEVMTELNKNVEENKADIAKNNASIEELYDFDNEVAESLGEIHAYTEEVNKTLENLITNSTNNTDNIAKNNASIEELYDFDNEVADRIQKIDEHNEQQNDTISKLITESVNNTKRVTDTELSINENKADIQKNTNAVQSLKDLYTVGIRTVGKNEKAIEEHQKLIADNKADIKTLAQAQIESATFLGGQIQENKADIAANKADADAKFVGVQTDIANNKTTLAQHTKKIDDNQKAIEAKLNGKADLQKLSELKTSVDKNQADIQLHDTKITNLATLFSWTTPTIGNNTKGVATNKADIAKNQAEIAKNKAEADENFETLTKNQNALAEQNETINQELEGLADHANVQDTLIAANKNAIEQNVNRTAVNSFEIEKNKAGIAKNQADIAANKADADAKFKGVQTDIANNKITLAEHTKKIDDNQQAIEAKLNGKADLQKLAELKTSVDKNQAGIQLHDQKINNLGILHTMVARAVGNNTQGVATNKADIAKNNESIEDLYEANAENVERLTQVDNNVFVNRLNIQELKRKQENDIKDVVGMQNAIAEQADKNKNHIQDLAKAQLAGVEVMDELNKNVEANKSDIQDLAKAQDAGVEVMKELNKNVEENKADIAKNKANIQDLAKAQDAGVEVMKELNKNVEENKAGIAANKADADAKFVGVQTDIANNKTTLAQHAKKIDDNQQAIEAKLGGKADTQVLTDLNNKVDGFDGRISALDTKVNAFDGRITALDSKVENGMAAQAALSGLFQPYSVGKFNATAALGGYGSKSAVAIGAGYRVNPNLAIKAGAAINTSGDKKGSYNIGVNYEF
ncbi:YadA-like family protein [Moraxella catarrhalis]|uniref:YadA-like family protein n=1 Tax=Moraxella catarrhalis TaxID=480 RepID=UPI00128DB49B|nr:YadA-like family protein [Moraxella catarrhalis]MPY07984.1 hypothetical protein [Moraxella catarrhalis]